MDDYKTTLGPYEGSARRILLVFAYLLVAVVQSLNPEIMTDPDLWWHLQTGQWIVDYGAAPQTDPFSTYGQGKPWVASSWLFEVLIFGLYRAFGLSGPIIYTVAMWLAIAILLLSYLRQHVTKLVNAVALACLGLYAAQMATPRPWLFTILFFIAEMKILLSFRQTGDPRRLFLLPFMFALWANLHIQFIYGLFVIGLVAVEPLFDRLLNRSRTIDVKAVKRLGVTLAACLLATLANPYHLKIYLVIHEYVSQTTPFHYIAELQSPDFHEPLSWLLLAAAIGAVFALAWRREIRPLPVLLLLAGILLAFRASRDMWFLSVVAVTVIASSSLAASVERHRILTARGWLAVAAATVISVFLVSRAKHVSSHGLEQLVSQRFPEAAAKIVEERGYAGPLYNHFNWGGYFIWRLPRLPVAMDGRTNLHGEKRIARSVRTWAGGRDWAADPELASANLVIGSHNDPLVSLLRLDHRFELVYEDQLAAVFVARTQSPVSNQAVTEDHGHGRRLAK